MSKDIRHKKYCNCQISSYKEILKNKVEFSFCEKCGCVILKDSEGKIYYTLKAKKKQLPLELNPVSIVKHMKMKTEEKYPMKKNHYEENLFAFEDKRFEFDMQIEIFQYAIDKLNQFKEKLKDGSIKKEDINEELFQKMLGKNVMRLIIRYYRELGQKVMEKLIDKTEGTINIIVKRFNQRIEEAKKKKEEEEKTIKSHFDRIYAKSFDYRSFKFKNFDKKNNNAKAFLKEIANRKKDKLTTTNINVLKGGNDNSEFFTTLNLKYDKENILNKTKDLSSLILLGNIDVNSMRKTPSKKEKENNENED